MPAPLLVDKDKVRALTLQIGPTETARQLGLNESTVKNWSSREGWVQKEGQVAEIVSDVQEKQGTRLAATTTQSEVIEKFRGKTKLSLCKVVDKTATGLKRLTPDQLVNRTGAVLNATSAYAKLYTDHEQGTSSVTVQLLNQVNIPDKG